MGSTPDKDVRVVIYALKYGKKIAGTLMLKNTPFS